MLYKYKLTTAPIVVHSEHSEETHRNYFKKPYA